MIVQPSAEPSMPAQVAAALQENTSLRIGTVVARTSSGLTLNVGGGLVSASYLLSYEPLVGDQVTVMRQEGTWLVLGSMGSSVTDLTAVPNHSFEDGAVGVLPPQWQLVTTAGSPALTAALWGRADVIDGPQVGRLTAGSTATITCEVVSDPVMVAAGEVWSAAAWVAATTGLGASTAASVELRLAWYSDSTLGSFLSENASGFYAVTRGMPWRMVSASGDSGRPVPVGAAFMRVKLGFSWSATSGETINFDRFLARRVA